MSTGAAVVGVDAGTQDRDTTEHLLRLAVDAVGGVDTACTHFVSLPAAHWAVSLVLPPGGVVPPDLGDRLGASVVVLTAGDTARSGFPDWTEGAAEAAALRRAGSGRAVVFGGWDALPDVLPVADVPAVCAVEAVEGVGGTSTEGAVLHTRGFVRPQLRDGRLVLLVRPYADDGTVTPLEVPDPVACCALHA